MSPFSIRAAVAGDEHTLFELIQALARFEHLEDGVTGSAHELRQHLFGGDGVVGGRPVAEALLAEEGGAAIGFALFFTNFSTFLTRPGIYLEDLFVLESHRRQGVGRALLAEVRRIAEARGAGRLEWAVLDWNTAAIDFYRGIGADVMPDWRLCRVRLRR